MSASFNYYQNTYGGEILTAETFPAYVKRADTYLEYITAGKVTEYLGNDTTGLDTTTLDKVYMAECAVADQYVVIEESKKNVLNEINENGAVLASETVGAHSQSFRSGYETAAEAESTLYTLAQRYLAWTGLLFRGVLCTRHT